MNGKIIHIKNHPYIFTAFLFLFCFIAFGTFNIQTVTAVNYIGAIILTISALYIIFSKKDRVHKTIKKESKKPIYILMGVLCVLVMLSVFAKVPRIEGIIEGRNSLVIFVFLMAAAFLYCIYLSIKKKWSYQRILFIIFCLGFIIHLYYNIRGDLYTVQNDIGSFKSDGSGHLGYIEYIYNHNFRLPQFDPREKWQYYHPPLHHICEALLLKVQTLCGVPFTTAIYNCQFPPLLYCMMTITISYRIFREIGLRKKALCVSFAIVTFCPAFVYMGGRMNNDIMSVMFMMACVLNTIKWYKNQNIRNILMIALCFGLGMLSKMSVWIVAPPIAVIFITVLVQKLRQKDFKSFRGLFSQMCVFLLIAAPMSFYWSIRNYVRFGVPIGYIPEAESMIADGASQYISQPILQRIFDFSPYQLKNPFTAVGVYKYSDYNEYNPIVGLLKSSSTGNGVGLFMEWAAHPLLWTTIILALISFIFMIIVLFKKKTMPVIWKWFFSVFYLFIIVSYYIFCFKYPNVCTEEIRYASPVIIIGAMFVGIAIQKIFNKNNKSSKLIRNGTIALSSVYCVLSFAYIAIYTSMIVCAMQFGYT